MQDYLLNVWYMAAWATEIDDGLFPRRLLGTDIVLTRSTAGGPIALRDRCPHRFAPLSRGRRVGDRIVCGYHGLAFDERGHCVDNPFSSRIPAGAAITAYPVVERDDIIWIWFGAPALADPALIPDFSETTAGPHGTRISGHTSMSADYEYGTDNLLDLSHIEFVHTGTFAGNGVIFRGQHSIDQSERQLSSNWWMPNVQCPAGLRMLVGSDEVDHWLDMRWDAPASMYLRIGATRPGEPRQAGAEFRQAHILTPADKGETHYFWSANSRQLQPPERADMLRTMLRQAFDVEDKPMIEAAYRNVVGDFWDEKPLSLGIDAGGVRARRMVQAMKRAETAAVA